MKMQLFLTMILSLFWTGNCEAQSQFHQKMPEIVKLNTISVNYCKKSSPSQESLRCYQADRKKFDEWIVKPTNQPEDDSPIKTIAEAETFLQGKWRASGGSGIRAWYLEWTFDKGKFRRVGYPFIRQEGKYKIISVEKSKITLELFEQKRTFGEKTKTIEILIDSQTKLLKIWQMENFSRVVE